MRHDTVINLRRGTLVHISKCASQHMRKPLPSPPSPTENRKLKNSAIKLSLSISLWPYSLIFFSFRSVSERQCACAHLRFHWHIVKALPHKFEEKRSSFLLSSTSVRFGTIYFGWKLSNGNNTNFVMGRPNGKREKSGRQIVDFICTESECDTKVHSMLNANIIMGKR